jgi:hypothetical protein
LGLPDPDSDPDPPSSSKNSKKTLTLSYTLLGLLYDFLSLKNDVNAPSKSKSILKVTDEKNKIRGWIRIY